MKCKNCKEKDAVKYSKYSNGEFCSRECARGYSTKKKRNEINEKVSISLKQKRVCKYCATEIHSRNVCSDCVKFSQNVNFYKKVGVFTSNVNLGELNKQCLQRLLDLYFNKNLSCNDIGELIGVHLDTVNRFFKRNDIVLRNLSESTSIAYLHGKLTPSSGAQYQHGWHTTWDGKQVYYRSSYELDYAKKLDEQKIPYEMEFKRFLYYDTQLKKYRVAIPDFYLPLENKIVEIKSDWTYDEQRMRDRRKVYEEQGYSFELMLDGCIL